MDNTVDFGKSLWCRGFPLLFFITSQAIAASFYGDGFVLLKTVESSTRNSLEVHFRTSHSGGLLFLAAGDSNFLLVELQSGRVQVTMDLGSGERNLRSEKGTQLNDLMWHTLELLQDHHNVTLTVDKTSQTSLRMPGPDLELSIQDGLFVGGIGGLVKPYVPAEVGTLVGFRGCLGVVLFNEHNLLSSLRPYSGYKQVYEVSLGCSAEFSASVDEPISFFSSRAYVSLPAWHAPQEGIFECELHRSAQDGIIFYSATSGEHFIALELKNGYVVALIGEAIAKTELRIQLPVNDPEWHEMKLHLSAGNVYLAVGKDIQKSSLGMDSGSLQFSGAVFIGGVDGETRELAKKQGLYSLMAKQVGGGSLRGCVRNVKVNAQKMGLPHALVTKDISASCDTETASDLFVTPNPVDPTLLSLPSGADCKRGQSFLIQEDLIVPEGGRAPLLSRHIKLHVDLRGFGIGQSQVMVRIEEQPVHGQLRLDVDPDQEENTFSLLDLWHGRVMYVHGGSESRDDFFIFSVFGRSKRQLPACMRGNKLHRFNISVTPSNDAPEIMLPEGNLFVLLEQSKRQLTTEFLRVIDQDSNSTDLIFTLLGSLSADAGFLEVEDNPAEAVKNFSYLNVEQEQVYYVHTGIKNSRMALRVSDGDKVSNTVILRVMAVPLEYGIVNNTGLEVNQGGWAVLSTKHLAVQINSTKQVVDVRYDVVEPPQYGELQRLHSSGEWKNTLVFSQKLLEKDRIRYLSTYQGSVPGNVTDSFRFRVMVGTSTTKEMLFHIVVQGVHYKVVKSKMQLEGERRVTITPQDLRAVPKGMKISESDLQFLLLSLPKKGKLLLDSSLLLVNSTFSQKNISDLKLEYEMEATPSSDTKDTFTFLIYTNYSYSGNHEFRFVIKAATQNIILTNLGLSLKEGESKVITRGELFAEATTPGEIRYFIKAFPKYGRLKKINLSNSISNNENISQFSNQDILRGRLLYVHDGSETTYDEFTFLVNVDPSQEYTAEKGTFKISIELVNDEKPIRVVDKIFHVVKNGQRLITLEDLCYHDGDTDFDSGQLTYTRRGIPMGEIVLVNDTSQNLYQFRQKDLEDKRVLFVHSGVNYGRFVIFVSDGKHYVSSVMEVIAQDPYIKVAENTGLAVQRGKATTWTSANFSVSTNVDVQDDQDMTFHLFNPPRYGRLYCSGATAKAFTLHNLKSGHMKYRHDDSANLLDFFNVTVRVKGQRVDAGVVVRAYLESHQQPPTVIQNNLVVVEETKSVNISRKELEVIHADSRPSEIVFTVKRAPSSGILRRSKGEDKGYQGSKERPLQSFSQQDINGELLQYVHTGSELTSDTILLGASNGLTGVSDITVNIDVIPQYIPLSMSNLVVREGSSRALTTDVLMVSSQQFSGLNFLYQVIEEPSYGQIEHSRFPGVAIPAFSRIQAEQGLIYYVHDGSESLMDNFTLIANDTVSRRNSLPRVMWANITPVNDEVPTINVNKILKVWEGSVTEITTDDLNAEDKDSPPEQLEFIVTPPTNGHLGLKSAPSRPILNFTQTHISTRQLVFVHSGSLSGGFHFQVNDGENFAERETFSTVARTLVLSLNRNFALRVFPGSQKPITDDDLLVVTNDFSHTIGNRDIIYTVTHQPKLGRLVKLTKDNMTEEITSFTQNMVNNKDVLYEQTDREAVGWEATDSFIFTVLSSPASLQPHTFNIEISYDNAGPEHGTILLANTGAVVPEGGTVVIDKSKLDASNLLKKLKESQSNIYEVWYRVTSLPSYGVISIGDKNLTDGRHYFSQATIDQGAVTYTHDDSENHTDSFTFDIWPSQKSRIQQPQERSEVVSETFSITVTPINDQPPVSKTVDSLLKVVHGDTVPLTFESLYVEDQDTPPEELQYTVLSSSHNGYLALRDRRNESVLSFTQDDINSGQVLFIQDVELTPGSFNFSVTDGVHKPLQKRLMVEIEQATLTMMNNTGLTLRQGQFSVVFTRKHLAARTNKQSGNIKYHVTRQPLYGSIRKDGQQVVEFEQGDLLSEKLTYEMTDLTSPEDSFELNISVPEVALKGQKVKINVSPMIYMRHHVTIPSGIAMKLRRNVIDASELAALSGDDPLFQIISPPKHGRLVKFGQSGSSTIVKSFTFQDVIGGRVAIEENANITSLEGNLTLNNITSPHRLNDSFKFLLMADNVQPAKGEFMFTVVPYKRLPGMPGITIDSSQTTDFPLLSNTNQSVLSQHPHSGRGHNLRPHKHKHKAKTRTRSGGQGSHDKPGISNGPKTASVKPPITLQNIPVWFESMPRPSADPLLIILPLLACLFLIVILIVLILVFRRRREKRAQHNMMRELAAMRPTEEQLAPRSPCLGTPERSVAVPSVVVTPVRCPNNASLDGRHRDQLLAAMSPLEPPYILCAWTPLEPVEHEAMVEDQVSSPTLGESQYWV